MADITSFHPLDSGPPLMTWSRRIPRGTFPSRGIAGNVVVALTSIIVVS